MARRRSRKNNMKGVKNLSYLLTFLIAMLISFAIRLLMFTYDVITIYTSKYKMKSGNGFFKTYFDKGNYGEFKLYRKTIRIFGKDNVFTNIYLENERTDYTEIDVLALSENGIYVFEMKNYSGYIFGSENDDNWTQVLNKSTKNKFYNPLRQNYAHTKAMEKFLSVKEKEIIPVIVFSSHSKLSKINVSMDKHIIQFKDVKRFIKKHSKTVSNVISKDMIKEYSIKLIERSNMPQKIKDKHIEQVKLIERK